MVTEGDRVTGRSVKKEEEVLKATFASRANWLSMSTPRPLKAWPGHWGPEQRTHSTQLQREWGGWLLLMKACAPSSHICIHLDIALPHV
jgi:hypothetical protein